MGNGLPSDLELGPVHLEVADLNRSQTFYESTLGLDGRAGGDDEIRLSAGDRILVVLHEKPGASPKPRNATGLYHYALLLPGRPELGRALQNLLDADYPLQGASDHLVSEAVYLADPDGNGIELYRDRPRESWSYDDGRLRMATEPLDMHGVLDAGKELSAGAAVPDGSVVGHVHLHVGDLAEAEQFYGEVIGFDLMTRYGRQASFYSAGGYHHHLGINVWAGVGAPRSPEDAAGLRHFTVVIPGANELGELADRLQKAEVDYEEHSGSLEVADPAGNKAHFVLASVMDDELGSE
ncbi:MAG: VOC family protein [Anaerolineales bacterium]|nr:VOC family protein [Anaerolineales bacterium]